MSNNNKTKVVNIQLATWREQMLTRLLPLTAAIATIGIGVGIISVTERGKEIYIPIYVGAWLLLLVITFFRRLNYRIKASILLSLIAILGITVLSETGLSGEGRSFLVVLPIATMILLGWRYSLVSLALGTSVFLLFGFLKLPAESQVDSGNITNWALAATLAAMLATGVIISLRSILGNLLTTLEKEARVRRQLHDVSDHWERKVAVRTDEFERLSTQLAISVEIGRIMNAQRDPKLLLDQIAHLLGERLDLDHVAIFMSRNQGKSAELEAAAGESASRCLTEGRTAQMGDGSLVGWCLEHGRGRMIVDKSELVPPLLPETRSAMSLPLRVGEQIMGAVELQTNQASAFGSQDLLTLQKTANQIAIAIENARLFQKARAGSIVLPSGEILHQDVREEKTRQIIEKMRRAVDMKTLLQTAIRDTAAMLDIPNAFVQLSAPRYPAIDQGENEKARTDTDQEEPDWEGNR